MELRFLCSRVCVTYPDISARLNSLIKSSYGYCKDFTWEIIKKYLQDGNYILVVFDLDLSCRFEDKIVAVSFLTFTKVFFDGSICFYDLFIDDGYLSAEKKEMKKNITKEMSEIYGVKNAGKIYKAFRSSISIEDSLKKIF